MCKLIMVLAIILLVTSCKKTVTMAKEDEELIIPGNNSEPRTLYPTKIATDKLEMKFSYKGNMLTQIEYGKDSIRILNLDSRNQPYLMEVVKGNTIVSYSEYDLDVNNLVIKIKYFQAYPENKAVGYSNMEYDDKRRLTKIRRFDMTNKLLNESTRTYDSSGNLLTEKSMSSGQTISYSYDTKNAIFKQLQYNDLFSIDTNNKLFLSLTNNIKTSTGHLKATEDASYTYVYDKHNYPTKMDIVINKIKTAYAVIYE